MFLLCCSYIILCRLYLNLLFFFNDAATTEIYTLSLHDALPIRRLRRAITVPAAAAIVGDAAHACAQDGEHAAPVAREARKNVLGDQRGRNGVDQETTPEMLRGNFGQSALGLLTLVMQQPGGYECAVDVDELRRRRRERHFVRHIDVG